MKPWAQVEIDRWNAYLNSPHEWTMFIPEEMQVGKILEEFNGDEKRAADFVRDQLVQDASLRNHDGYWDRVLQKIVELTTNDLILEE